MGRMRSAFISPLDPRLNCGVPWHFTQGLCQTTALFICFLTIIIMKNMRSLWKSLQDAQDLRMVFQVFDLCPICFPYVSHAPMAAPTRPTGLRFWPSKVYQEVGNGQGAQGTRNPAGISWEWGWQWLTNGWPMAGWKSLGFGMRTGMGRTGRSAAWWTVTIWENHGQHLGVAGESERVTLQRCWHVWIHNFFFQLSNLHAKFCDMYVEQVAWATAARRVMHF